MPDTTIPLPSQKLHVRQAVLKAIGDGFHEIVRDGLLDLLKSGTPDGYAAREIFRKTLLEHGRLLPPCPDCQDSEFVLPTTSDETGENYECGMCGKQFHRTPR